MLDQLGTTVQRYLPQAAGEFRCADAPELVIARCIVCGCLDFHRDYPIAMPWLARCHRCGLALANPQPDRVELAAIYNAAYYSTFGFDAADKATYRLLKQRAAERLLRRAERLIPRGRLLDVGCGVGDLLAIGSRRGWQVRGVEPNEHGAAAADEVAPGGTFAGTIEQLREDEGPFDLITCLDVLEHLRRPDDALTKMRGLLAPGGILMIAAPDAGSLLARLMGARWPHYHRDHLWYFSRPALRRLLEDSGLEVMSQGPCWKTFNLRYVLGILAEHPHTGLFHHVATGLKRRLPRWLLRHPWLAIPEGQLVLARKPRERELPAGPGERR